MLGQSARKPTCRRIPAGLRRVSAATAQMSRRKRDCVSDGPADPQMAREGSCLHEPKANPLSSRSPGMRRFLQGFPRTRGDAGQRGLQTRRGRGGNSHSLTVHPLRPRPHGRSRTELLLLLPIFTAEESRLVNTGSSEVTLVHPGRGRLTPKPSSSQRALSRTCADLCPRSGLWMLTSGAGRSCPAHCPWPLPLTAQHPARCDHQKRFQTLPNVSPGDKVALSSEPIARIFNNKHSFTLFLYCSLIVQFLPLSKSSDLYRDKTMSFISFESSLC